MRVFGKMAASDGANSEIVRALATIVGAVLTPQGQPPPQQLQMPASPALNMPPPQPAGSSDTGSTSTNRQSRQVALIDHEFGN